MADEKLPVATAVVVLILLGIIIYLYVSKRPVTPPARIVYQTRVPVSDQPNATITLEKAVDNLLHTRGLNFQEMAPGMVFGPGITIPNQVPTDEPWDEQLEKLLKPFNLEFELNDGTVYIGRNVRSCLRLNGLKRFRDLSGLMSEFCR